MIRASVSHTRNHLSSLLSQVKAGETILITDRDQPIARIVPAQEVELDEWIAELARLGQVRLPLGPPIPIEEIKPIELENGGYAGALEALLEERAEGW